MKKQIFAPYCLNLQANTRSILLKLAVEKVLPARISGKNCCIICDNRLCKNLTKFWEVIQDIMINLRVKSVMIVLLKPL